MITLRRLKIARLASAAAISDLAMPVKILILSDRVLLVCDLGH
jgi:hypothetical protein